MVDRSGPQPEGYILLSHEKAARLRAWDNLEQAHRDGLVLSGRVLERTKGGLAVDVGVVAFMPGSQIDVGRRTTWTCSSGKTFRSRC